MDVAAALDPPLVNLTQYWETAGKFNIRKSFVVLKTCYGSVILGGEFK